MKIIADDKIPFLRGALEPVAEVVYMEGKKISRADVMDADAIITRTRTMVSGLRNGRIGHAVVDVWENEPDISRDLLSLATIATPHIAGYSTDSKLRGTTMAVAAL